MACIGSIFPNCSAIYTTIQPDPDIDGVGVVTSFIVSAAITLVVSIAGIWVEARPEKEPHKNLLPIYQSSGSARAYEHWLCPPISSERKHYWMAIIERFILGLADQQLVTGTAILIVGYLKCDITAYHFTIVGDLAWFSSNTHLTSIEVLCHYFQEHHAARTWRITLMLAMCAMLMASTVFQFNGRWYQSLPVPAQCVFAHAYSLSDNSSPGYLVFTLLLPLSGYGLAIASMFSTSFLPGLIEKRYVRFRYRMNERYLELRKVPWIELSSGDEIKAACLWIFLANKTVIGIIFDLFWFAYGISNFLSDQAKGAGLMDESSTIRSHGGLIFWEEKKNCETKEFQARKDAIKDSRARQRERTEQRILTARSDACNEYNGSQDVTATVFTTSTTNTQALSSSTRSNNTDVHRSRLDIIPEQDGEASITSSQTDVEIQRGFDPPRHRRSWRTVSLTSPSDDRESVNAGQTTGAELDEQAPIPQV